jgi:Rrf2 family transcriptional regulator, cysteine metabolism repressor
MKLSRTVAYAVQASLHLAHENSSEPVPCSRLAAEGQMPERFLLQILRNLVAHGILTSTRGVDGGYSLLRDPEDISLLDIIEAIDGPLVPNLHFGEGLPSESQSRLKEAISDVTEESRRQLATIRMIHLLPKPAVELVGEVDK